MTPARRRRQLIEGAIASYQRVSPDAMRAYWLSAQVRVYVEIEAALRGDYPGAADLVASMASEARSALAEVLSGKPAG